MVYRGDPAASEARRLQLVRMIEDLEQKWTATFWYEVAPAYGIMVPSTDFPGLTLEAEISRLSARLDVLEDLEQRAHEVLAAWEQVQPLTRPRAMWTHRPRDVPPMTGAAFDAWGERALAEVEARGSDLPLCLEASVWRANYNVPYFALHLVVACAPGLGNLTLRARTLGDDFRTAFGSRRDVWIGNGRFDRAFSIDAHEATARAILDPAACEALIRMLARGAVSVRIAAGRARIGQCYLTNHEVDPAWIADAVHVARSIHRAPARALRFR